MERILAAAREVFREKGYREASVQEISAVAGYTTGAIYSSFKGKDELFLEVVRRGLRSETDNWRATLNRTADPSQAAAAMGSLISVKTLDRAWNRAIFEFVISAARDEKLAPEATQIFRSGTQLVAEILGNAADLSPLSLERLSAIIMALFRGFHLTWFVDPASEDASLFADAIAVLLGVQSASFKPRRSRPGKAAAGRRTATRAQLN